MEINMTVLQEAIYSRLAKAKAITTCMLSLPDNHALKPQQFMTLFGQLIY